jgi:hypothetical protein
MDHRDQIHLSPALRPWSHSLHRPRIQLMPQVWAWLFGVAFWGVLWWWFA